ncbi:MAG: hydrogenase maturation nickel metallochaperone HypA, partial [Bacteroidetes bacterium]
MHEVSLVRTIFRTLDEQFSPAERAKIISINLKIGPLANIEPLLLHNAFEAVLEEGEHPYRGARLQIEQVPIMVRCSA